MARARSELKNTGYEIFIGALSVLSILNLALYYIFFRNETLEAVLGVMNALFSAIFLVDFSYRLKTAPSRGAYFFREYGWADLLASLPFPQFKILRIFRLIRVNQLLGKKGIRHIWRTVVRDRANSALLFLLLMGILVLQFGSLAMLYFEADAPGANITSASDALWYTIVTISTVGYGDQYPVTDPGRMVGTLVIIVGVGIFGTFTGYLANFFLSPRRSDEVPLDAEKAPSEAASAPSAATADDAAVSAEAMSDLRTRLATSESKLAEIRLLLSGPPAPGRAPADN